MNLNRNWKDTWKSQVQIVCVSNNDESRYQSFACHFSFSPFLFSIIDKEYSKVFLLEAMEKLFFFLGNTCHKIFNNMMWISIEYISTISLLKHSHSIRVWLFFPLLWRLMLIFGMQTKMFILTLLICLYVCMQRLFHVKGKIQEIKCWAISWHHSPSVWYETGDFERQPKLWDRDSNKISFSIWTCALLYDISSLARVCVCVCVCS